MQKSRVSLVVLFLMAFVLTLFGGDQSEAEAGAASARTVLKVAVSNFAWRLDPAVKWSNNTAQMHINMHDGLVRLTPYEVPYRVEPAVAKSWKEISPTVTEFQIRKGVKFWDGTPVTAEDVAWSINRSLRVDHPRYKSYAGRWAYNFEKVEVMDPLTVRVHTKRPDPLALVMLAQTPASILSKKAYEAAKEPDRFFEHPLGCGPYRIAGYKKDQYLELERWDGYWGEKPPLEKLIYYNVPEVSSRITALLNGEVDFVVSIPPDQVVALEKRKGIKTLGITWDMFHVFALNATRKPLTDPRIRRAMNLSVDRGALNRAFWGGKGVIPTAHQYPGRTGYDPNWKVFEYNPEKAKQLVKEAGYDGTPIELNFGASYYLYIDQASQAIAKMWEKVGLNVKLQYVESWGKRDIPEKYVMTRSWSNPMYFPDMLGGFDPHWSPTGWPIKDGLNPQLRPGGELRDRYTELYERARYGVDGKERLKAYHELVEMLEHEATPWVILYQPREYFGMAKDIEWEAPSNYRPFTLPFRAGDIRFK
jgi:peptide/nickel transport system substrate-binding protein